MSQEDFLKWIDDAEKSPTMSLETFNEKWELEIGKHPTQKPNRVLERIIELAFHSAKGIF